MASLQPPGASASFPDFGSESLSPSGPGESRRGFSPLLLVGVIATLLCGLALARHAWDNTQAVRLLRGATEVRAAVRTLYNSQTGYGLPAGSRIDNRWTARGLPTGWSTDADGPVHNLGGAVRLRSQVRFFTLQLEGLRPAVCRKVLSALDSGWAVVRYDGSLLQTPVSPQDASRACGWFGNGALQLDSAG